MATKSIQTIHFGTAFIFGKDVLGFSDADEADPGGGGFETNASYDKVNMSQSLKWQRIYSPKFSHEITAVSTLFSYDILGKFEIKRNKSSIKGFGYWD